MPEFLSITRQDKRLDILPTSETGHLGEQLAAQFLEANGYRLVLANFKVPVGRNSRGAAVTGEIDIIALDRDTLCFVEVKTKASDVFAPPIAAVDRRKQRQIVRAARAYRKVFGLGEIPYRYDVVSVVLPLNAEPRIKLEKNFWTESVLRRKRIWSGDTY